MMAQQGAKSKNKARRSAMQHSMFSDVKVRWNALNSGRPELVEGPSFLLRKEEKGFDRLSPNGSA
jgi:hypothetical protein